MSRRRIGFWYRLAAVIAKPPLMVLFKRDWRGMEHIPADGGFITAVNHNSHLDPLVLRALPVQHRTRPALPRQGRRSSRPASSAPSCAAPDRSPSTARPPTPLNAFRAAVDAVERGRVRRLLPGGHPHPRPGPVADDRQDRRRARRAADQGARDPCRPVGRQRGARRRTPRKKPGLLPRKTHHVLAGPPVDLDALLRPGADPGAAREATEVIMTRDHRPARRTARRAASAAALRPP